VNEDHKETLSLYATQLLGRAEGPWRMTGLDPEGFDLASGDETARVNFPDTVHTPGELRQAFQALAGQARGSKS
jgi:heme iron utilization protein